MNQTDKRRGNGRDPEAIQREIQHTRGELDRTLEAIESRLSPGELLHEIWTHLSGREDEGKPRIGDTLSNIATRIADNPVPVALIGIGSVALLKGSGPTADEIKQGISDRRERSQGAKEKVAGAASGARERVSGTASAVAERASSAASTARQSITSGYEKVRQELEDNPLVLGALGFAMGAALGAAMPRTRFEDERLGEHRDQLASQLSEAGGEALTGTKRAISDVSESVKAQARPQGDLEGSLD